jgi:hypothetical protein
MSSPGIPAAHGGEDVNYWFLRNQPCFVQAQEGKARPRHLCAIVHIRIHVGEWDRPRSIPNRVAQLCVAAAWLPEPSSTSTALQTTTIGWQASKPTSRDAYPAAAGTRGPAYRWPAPTRRTGGGAGCWSAAAFTPGAGLLRGRRPGRPAVGRPGPGRRDPLAGRGGVPGRQGAVRPGRAPGPPLALLVPVGDPGHAGPGVPGGGRGHRARPPPTTVGAHPVDLQRDPAPVRRRGLPACRRPWAPVALVVGGGGPPPPPARRPPPPTTPPPSPTAATGCAGRGGDAATRPALVPATTADKPTHREGHELRWCIEQHCVLRSQGHAGGLCLDGRWSYERRILALECLGRTAAPALRQGR